MKIKVYLNDWFYNAGIVGFLRILEANDDEFAIKRNNYIEFDTESLRKFHKYYFKYFFQKYNVAENVENRTKNSFDYLENNIEVILENKDNIVEMFSNYLKGNVDFKGIIVKNVDAFSLEKLEEVTYTLAAREFKHIEVIGAILGAIIGFVQFIIGMIM